MRQDEVRLKLGQVFATPLPDFARFDLERFPFSNYIIFKDDLARTFEDSRRKLSTARSFLQEHGIEPIFMLDEEGGRVSQIEAFFTPAPSPLALSENAPSRIADVYAYISSLLSKLGIDVNLFPCLDVLSEPLNPVIVTRSFGSSSEKVISCTQQAIRASRRFVSCVGKHFPGHGMTRADSHHEKPIVVTHRRELESKHLPPFKQAIQLGIDGIMVSHCQYVTLQDDTLPASLSPRVVRNFLRGTLGFEGLVITDSLDMRAVTSSIAPQGLGILGLEAGCDILLFTEFSDRLTTAFESLVEAMLMGKIDIERLEQSLERRKRILERLKLLRNLPEPDIDFDYMGTVESISKKAIRVSDPNRRLPVGEHEIALLATSDTILGKIRENVETVVIPHDVGDVSDKVLLLWMMEPLHVPQLFRHVAHMIERARLSILVTNYDALVEHIPRCGVTVITHDTSATAISRLLTILFGRAAHS